MCNQFKDLEFWARFSVCPQHKWKNFRENWLDVIFSEINVSPIQVLTCVADLLFVMQNTRWRNKQCKGKKCKDMQLEMQKLPLTKLIFLDGENGRTRTESRCRFPRLKSFSRGAICDRLAQNFCIRLNGGHVTVYILPFCLTVSLPTLPAPNGTHIYQVKVESWIKWNSKGNGITPEIFTSCRKYPIQ